MFVNGVELYEKRSNRTKVVKIWHIYNGSHWASFDRVDEQGNKRERWYRNLTRASTERLNELALNMRHTRPLAPWTGGSGTGWSIVVDA